jgi:hypothetical protein
MALHDYIIYIIPLQITNKKTENQGSKQTTTLRDALEKLGLLVAHRVKKIGQQLRRCVRYTRQQE